MQVQGLTGDATVVAAGDRHTCAVINDSAQCWGSNDTGQLGNNSNGLSNAPVQVQGLTSEVTAVAVGYGHSCALANGYAYCWGYNNKGQLGNNSTLGSLIPELVQIP
jgi:alpha-tubulin suppressor-like RCC1 family protein